MPSYEIYYMNDDGTLDAKVAAECADDFVDQICRGMRDADAEPNARAHGGFPFLDGGGDGVAVFRRNFARCDEIAHQLVNGLPSVRCAQIGDDLLLIQNIG